MKKIREVLEGTAGVTAWTISRYRSSEHQRYLLADRPESERTVDTITTDVTIYHEAEGVMGRSSITLHGASPSLSSADAEAAVFRASIQGNTPYALPAPEAPTTVPLADPELVSAPRRVLDAMQERLFDAVAGQPHVRLSAGELFASRGEWHLLTSTGFEGRSESTRLDVEFVLLAQGDHGEQESFGSYGARQVDDLDLGREVNAHARRAVDLLDAELPRSGRVPVVMSEGAFIPILGPFAAATSGDMVFRGTSPVKVGESLFGEREVRGESLSLASDPTLAYGAASGGFDGEGLVLRRVPVVENNTVQHVMAPKQFADYLDLPATGSWRNRVIPGGTRPLRDLLDPADERVLHVVAFSWLNPDAVRGSFTTEIRLAYEITSQGTRAVRGGSLAGNAYDLFAHAFHSRETERRERYQGPAAIRFEGLNVTGA
jgi:predicted Zn-dependent protease